VRVHQVGGAGVLDVEKIILCGDLAQWHDCFQLLWRLAGLIYDRTRSVRIGL